MKRFFWIPFCLLLALFGAALLNAAVADGLVTDWCAELDKLQDTAQAENWDSVRSDLSALHESWGAHATYFHIILQHDELNEVESLAGPRGQLRLRAGRGGIPRMCRRASVPASRAV